jgi:hypothetical protein
MHSIQIMFSIHSTFYFINVFFASIDILVSCSFLPLYIINANLNHAKAKYLSSVKYMRTFDRRTNTDSIKNTLEERDKKPSLHTYYQ